MEEKGEKKKCEGKSKCILVRLSVWGSVLSRWGWRKACGTEGQNGSDGGSCSSQGRCSKGANKLPGCCIAALTSESLAGNFFYMALSCLLHSTALGWPGFPSLKRSTGSSTLRAAGLILCGLATRIYI